MTEQFHIVKTSSIEYSYLFLEEEILNILRNINMRTCIYGYAQIDADIAVGIDLYMDVDIGVRIDADIGLCVEVFV